jgi:PAS domain S-box-containing protein
MTDFAWVDTGGEHRVLQPLWDDGERLYCRTWRNNAEGVQQALMAVLPATEHPAPITFSRLAHEFALKDYLDGAWATRPLELVHSHGRTLLLLESQSTSTLDSLLGEPLELGTFLRLAPAITHALGRLHERGLVHRDIKPANILLEPVTEQVWLTGFGIASRLPRERQAPGSPETIAGTLAYMAPEQTGRMNRSVDSRSDLYALGVTFYQMLIGELPFTASDPMEWVHCHIARTPVPPQQRLGNIPTLISQIVMKLVAKTAEERYQTAAGVERDLRRCRTEWEMEGRIGDFPLGGHDAPDRLLIPEKLYGRSGEVAALLSSFNQVVATGMPELVLVSGYSGIGKSSVVNELHKALVTPHGLFASGKFDQYKRDIPYATVAQAFQSLVRQILSKSEAELRAWRDALREALGPNGLLIIDLIPELELVIGKQPPVFDLSAQDAQRRFQTALRRFIAVFARREHPLTLFLDDLQWLDTATLDLLEDLLVQRDIRHLLLIGAYRDNEVDAAHPLTRKLNAIRRAGATVQDIVLAPLTSDDLTQLISDSLRCQTEPATPLVRLVYEKTGGNPFFAIQFLSALADEALLVFDSADARWIYDLGRIQAKRYTDNVADLMVGKLNRLPGETQAALRLLACVGASAAFALLGAVCQTSQEELHESLWEAVRSGLVLRSENAYAFQHDRVQEAAYSLITKDTRAEAHLRAGRLLLAHTPPEKRDEIIFDIVNQFNRGAELITSESERIELAELNLAAGKRAKASTAYASALQYFVAGAIRLTNDCWERRHELIFQLELNRAECEFLTGQLSVADDRLGALSNRAATMVEQASVVCLHADLCTLLDRSDRAVAVCLNYLRQAGIDWSPHPNDEEARDEYERVRYLLGGRTIEVLIDSPLMQDPASLATIEVLSKLMVPAQFTDANLTWLTSCKAVSLSLERGNCDASCFAYVTLGSQTGQRFNDYDAGFRFAKVGYELVERRGLKRFEAGTSLRFAAVVAWMKHVRDCRDPLRRAFETASRIGDLTIGAYACNRLNTIFLFAGEPLPDAETEAQHALVFAETARFGLVVAVVTGQLALIRMLRGMTLKFGYFDDGRVSELNIESHLSSSQALTFAAFCYWVRKLQARYLAGDYGAAMDAASKVQPLLWSSSYLLEEAEYHFYSALSHAASHELAEPHERQQHLDALVSHHRKLQIWTDNCPENFENRAALVGAEIARLDGRTLDAEFLYEQAIRSSRANGFVHNEAIAYERASAFYRDRGLDEFADLYLRNARYGYLRWGADGKVRQLEARYPQLVMADPRRGSSEATPPGLQIDVTAVVKASQALSSEMMLPRLIERLMTVAIENAGADRGLLILPQENDYRIEAEARADGEKIVLHYGAAAGRAVPEAIVRYVMRTRESVILDDAAKQNLFSDDPYLGLRRQRSILCLPLLRQGTLVGLLYLENALASHVFTPDRARLLELLAAQAAISLENARLYSDLQEREAKVRHLIESNIIGICVYSRLDRRILEANDAFLGMLGYSRDEFVSRGLTFSSLSPPEWAEDDQRRLADLASTGTWKPSEKEFFRKDGSRVPVLIGSATFDESRGQGVAFVVDLTERKRAEAELAHANRVATMGQLSASIAHEVNQPIAAALINAGTAARWLARQPPNLEEARQAIDHIVKDGRRAADIVSRIRNFSKKAPVQQGSLEINEAILEIMSLTRVATSQHGVLVKMQLSEGLPHIFGDRVQLQQVILNLIMNAVEAMSEVSEGLRELLISTSEAEASGVLVAVSDTGPGLPHANPERLFEAFYTTKVSGLGMGLSICRSIIQNHGGRLLAAPNEPRGAVFSILLPVGEKPVENVGPSNA